MRFEEQSKGEKALFLDSSTEGVFLNVATLPVSESLTNLRKTMPQFYLNSIGCIFKYKKKFEIFLILNFVQNFNPNFWFKKEMG